MSAMKPTPKVQGLSGINREQRLYVIPCGSGFSCLGFDVAKRKTASVAEWLQRPDLMPPARVGTVKAWRAYQAAMRAGAMAASTTGQKCEADLTPALRGLEGRRVEVIAPGENPRRFYVGKSTGWLPIHLEIARRDSHGGGAAYVPAGATVRVIEGARRY